MVSDPIYRQPDRRLTVVDGAAVAILQGVAHRGDIAEPHDGARFGADDWNSGEFARPVAAVADPQKHVAARGLDAAARDLDRHVADDGGDLIDAQTVGAKPFLGNLNLDFMVPRAYKVDLRDAGILEHSVVDFFGDIAQHGIGNVAVEFDVQHVAPTADELDIGLAGVLRKGVDGVDFLLDVVEGFL